LLHRAILRADSAALVHALNDLAAGLTYRLLGRHAEQRLGRAVPGHDLAQPVNGKGGIRCALDQLFDLTKPHVDNLIIKMM
jgi:hypothetical protein